MITPPFELGIVLGRAVVGLTFVLAGVLKVKAGSQWFLKTILAYNLVHGKAAVLLSKGLPWVEIACGVFLVLGFFTPPVTVASFVVLLSFTSALASAILRDKPVNCGCFGQSTQVNRMRWTLVYRNIVLMGLLLPVYTFGWSSLSVDAWLKMWPPHNSRDALTQAWLIATWVISVAVTMGLQTLTRKRITESSEELG